MTSDMENPPQMKSSVTQMYLLFMLLFMIVIFIPELRFALGRAAGFVLEPLFSFNYRYPIYTMLAMGVLVTLINSAAAHHYTNWITMAKNQARMRAFNEVYREALRKQDMAKLEKLRKIQLKLSAESMETQSQTMKGTMITWLIVIAIFTWLWLFMQYSIPYTYVAIPWAHAVDLNKVSYLFPNWLLIYSSFTMPLAWVVRYIFKYFEFRKKLEEIQLRGLEAVK